ncbi:MAG: SixA phosphatase family protein, partial [Flavobacteriales bacterium]
MRTLYLCRHAKSSWANPGQLDHERPLNERGLRDAPAMARFFHQRGEPIDLIVTSDAHRALATARCFAEELSLGGERFRIDPALYHASARTIAALVARLPDEAPRVMLFGHNPGFTEAVDFFASEGPANMPTCGLARIDFPVRAWADTG